MAEDMGVKMDGTDVIQILQNLIVNAFQCAAKVIAWLSGVKFSAFRWI